MRKTLINQREAKGLSQREVAKAIGVSRQLITDLEREARVGTVRVWDKLERFFKVPQQELRESDRN
jgi:transcriptional regulator with XRE-family HTH domain